MGQEQGRRWWARRREDGAGGWEAQAGHRWWWMGGEYPLPSSKVLVSGRESDAES